MRCDWLKSDDAFHLSRLTGLTKLDLKVVKGIGDGACVALECRLTGLMDLKIVTCDVMKPAVLPALANSPAGLTRMYLGLHSMMHNDVVMYDALLLQLTGLQRLCELTFDGVSRCGVAAQQQLLSAVPSLTSLVWL